MFGKLPFFEIYAYFIDLSDTAFAVPPPLMVGEAIRFICNLSCCILQQLLFILHSILLLRS